MAYDVLRFQSNELDGRCDRFPDGTRQILLADRLSAKELEITLFHELCHAISFEYEVNLTEKQVLKLEKALPALIRLNKDWLKL